MKDREYAALKLHCRLQVAYWKRKVKRFFRKCAHFAANCLLALCGRRLLLAEFDAPCRVWLDGEERSGGDAWRALVPRRAGREGRGWADIYLKSIKGGYVVLGDYSPAWTRKYGAVKWERP